MSVQLSLFMTIGIIIIYTSYKMSKRILNIPTILITPYLFVIPINNILMTKYNFYDISNETIEMILLASFCVTIGSLIAEIRRKKKSDVGIYYDQSDDKFNYYSFDKMVNYVIIVEIITVARFLITLLTEGAVFIVSDEYESGLIKGFLGHLFLTIYPLLPILFYYWLKHKNRIRFLFASCFGLCLFFLTFVKYHSIGLVVITFFLVSFEDFKYFKKGIFTVVVFAISFFVLNYFISFVARGTTNAIKDNYYLEHLWNYISGSIIYDNDIFLNGVRVNVSIFYKLLSFTMAPINLILDKLDFDLICPHEALPYIYVGSNGEMGNVIDALGYLYPSKGGLIDLLLYIIVLTVIGFIFTQIYNRELRPKNRYAITLCIFLSFFVFFSFFGTFYVSFVPYEMIFWSIVMLKLFDRRIKVKMK